MQRMATILGCLVLFAAPASAQLGGDVNGASGGMPSTQSPPPPTAEPTPQPTPPTATPAPVPTTAPKVATDDVGELEAVLHRSLAEEHTLYQRSWAYHDGRGFSDFLWQRARTRRNVGIALTFTGIGALALGVGAGFAEFSAEGRTVGVDPLGDSPATIAIIGVFGSLGIGSLIAGAVIWSRYAGEESRIREYRRTHNLARISLGAGPMRSGGTIGAAVRF